MFSPKIDNKLPEGLICFCKDCGKIVPTTAVGRKFAYKCNVCGTKNVAFGSEKSIRNFYRVKAEGETAPSMTAEEKKAMNADKL